MKKIPAEIRSLKLSAKLLTARTSLLLENFIRSFGLAFLWIAIFICIWLTGFSSVQTTWLFWIVLAIAVSEGALKFRLPAQQDIYARLETASRLLHRPLQSLTDDIATPDTLELWQLEKARQKDLIPKLRYTKPSFDLARHDPYALRIFFILVVVCALFISPDNFIQKIKTGLLLPENTGTVATAQPMTQITITSPAYSGEKVQILNQSSSKPVKILQGSRISAEIKTGWGYPVLKMGDERIALKQKDDTDIWTADAVIPETTQVKITTYGISRFSQKIDYIKDKPPEIAWNGEISVLPSGELRIPLKVTDDYGIQKLTLRGILVPGETPPLFGSRMEIEKKLTLAIRNSAVDINPVFDATGHPWAGWKVSLLIEAEDFAGNVSETTPVDMVLPKRTFRNPVAAALSEIRASILAMRGTVDALVDATDNILTQPEIYKWDNVMTLGLRSVSSRLSYATKKDDLESTAGLIWALAMRMEDGRVSETQKSLQEALQNLQDAIQKGADKAEIAKLMQDMQQALMEHLRTMAGKLQSLVQKGDKLQLQQSLNLSSLGDFLKKLQEEIQNGDSQSALKKLNDLQQMAEMMGSSMAQGVPKDVQKMMENIESVQDMIMRQKKLLDITRAPASKNLPAMTKEQKDIKKTAEDLTAKLPLKIEQFETAKDEMGLSAQELGQGSPEGSVPHQEKVLSGLKQTGQDMQQQLQKRLQNMMGISMGSMSGKQDPLGRQTTDLNDDGTRIPGGVNRKKSDEIIKTLREREADMKRPLEERNYYQRLLKQW